MESVQVLIKYYSCVLLQYSRYIYALIIYNVLSGNSMIGHRGLVSIPFAYRETLVGCNVVLVVMLALTGTVVGITAFFSYSLFLLYSPCHVLTTYDTTIGGLYPHIGLIRSRIEF